MILLPHAVQNVQPFAGARIPVVVLLERYAILSRFVRPPRRNHVQRQSPIADLIDVRCLLGQQRRQMKCWAHSHHQFNSVRYRSQRRCRGPRIQRRRFNAFNVVEIQLRDQRQVETNLFAALSELLYVRPARFHVFVFHIAQPPAENRQPVPVSHRGPPLVATRSPRLASCRSASEIKKSASRAYGLKPTTRTGSATKFESAFTS